MPIIQSALKSRILKNADHLLVQVKYILAGGKGVTSDSISQIAATLVLLPYILATKAYPLHNSKENHTQ